jgi:hypothetical protein
MGEREMKAYGIPRDKEKLSPDAGTIREYGMKSSAGKLREKSGEFKGYIRGSASKRRTRRRFKRNERARACREIEIAINEDG